MVCFFFALTSIIKVCTVQYYHFIYYKIVYKFVLIFWVRKMIKKIFSNEVRKEIQSDGKEVFWFKVTSEVIDRQNEIVKATSYNIDKFMENPVMFFQHNSFDLPIGLWVDYKIEKNELYLAGWFHQLTDEEGNELSKTVKDYVEKGILKATSIGFQNINSHIERIDNKNIKVYDEIDLIEVSIVTIGANPDALAKMLNNEDIMEITEKAGSVLSKSNKEKLTGAVSYINEVLESAGKEEPEQEQAKNYDNDILELNQKIDSLNEINQKLLQEIELLKPKKIKFTEL